MTLAQICYRARGTWNKIRNIPWHPGRIQITINHSLLPQLVSTGINKGEWWISVRKPPSKSSLLGDTRKGSWFFFDMIHRLKFSLGPKRRLNWELGIWASAQASYLQKNTSLLKSTILVKNRNYRAKELPRSTLSLLTNGKLCSFCFHI